LIVEGFDRLLHSTARAERLGDERMPKRAQTRKLFFILARAVAPLV
jgi:hypothetical protein